MNIIVCRFTNVLCLRTDTNVDILELLHFNKILKCNLMLVLLLIDYSITLFFTTCLNALSFEIVNSLFLEGDVP